MEVIEISNNLQVIIKKSLYGEKAHYASLKRPLKNRWINFNESSMIRLFSNKEQISQALIAAAAHQEFNAMEYLLEVNSVRKLTVAVTVYKEMAYVSFVETKYNLFKSCIHCNETEWLKLCDVSSPILNTLHTMSGK